MLYAQGRASPDGRDVPPPPPVPPPPRRNFPNRISPGGNGTHGLWRRSVRCKPFMTYYDVVVVIIILLLSSASSEIGFRRVVFRARATRVTNGVRLATAVRRQINYSKPRKKKKKQITEPCRLHDDNVLCFAEYRVKRFIF